MATVIEKAKTEIAVQISEDPEKIRIARSDWARLMGSGVVVTIHIRRWRGKTKLNLEDLGLDPDPDNQSVLDELLNLGEKKLLPPWILRELDACESSARKTLEYHAYKTYWGSFIPATGYQAWKADNQKLVDRYFSLRDQLTSDWDQIISTMVYNYKVAAKVAWGRLSQDSRVAMRMTEYEFVEKFVSRIRGMIPSKEVVYQSFEFTTDLNYIPLPSLLAKDKKEEAQIQADTEKIYNQRNDDNRIRQAQIQMEREVKEKAMAQKSELIEKFMYDIQSQLKNSVYEASADVLSSIDKGGSLNPRSVVQLKGLIDKINNLNFWEDPDLESMVKKLRGYVDQRSDDRDLPSLTTSLRSIATITRSQLLDLGDSPRSGRSLGIVDHPTVEMVRQARGSLGMDQASQEEIIPPVEVKRTPRDQRKAIDAIKANSSFN